MHYIIGIDEAGRGPWAGPVVAGGFLCTVDFDFGIFAPHLDDSKKLSESQREDIFSRIEKVMESNICRYQFAYRDAADIDRLGIREANRQCMEESILGLMQYTTDDDTIDIFIDGCDNYEFGIDGFEYIFAKKRSRKKIGTISDTGGDNGVQKILNQKSSTPYNSYLITHNSITYMIDGDSLSPVISAASIVAKVTRDKMLCDFHEEFPEYGWDTNKGYGTAKHREAIINYGISPIHRKSYEPMKSLILSGS